MELFSVQKKQLWISKNSKPTTINNSEKLKGLKEITCSYKVPQNFNFVQTVRNSFL